MNPLEKILSSRFDQKQLIQDLNTKTALFNEAIELCTEGKHPIGWRAAWILNHAIQNNDKRIVPFISLFIESIPNKPDGHQRELVRILTKMDLDDEQEGRLFDLCMNIWEAVGKSPSSRIKAFEFILKTAKKHPELKNEIAFLTQEQYTSSLSPGIQNSLKKRLKYF